MDSSDSSEVDFQPIETTDSRRQSEVNGGTPSQINEAPRINGGKSGQDAVWAKKSTTLTKELVETAATKQNWRGIIISLAVILAVCLLIVIAVVIMTPRKVEKDDRKALTFADFLYLEHTLKLPHYTWVSDNEYAHLDDKLGIVITDAENREIIKIIIPHQILKSLDAKDFSFSPDMKYVLIEYDKAEIFRHSFRAKYQLYDITNSQLNPLGPNYPSQSNEDTELRCVTWSPSDHKLVFVHQNDIYYLADALSTPFKITDSHASEYVYNGIPDWLYEEEILMAPCSIYWSAGDGKHLAYGRLNYSFVPRQPMILFGDKDDIYPTLKMLPYPKVGQNNPEFAIVIVDPLAPTNKVELKFPPLKSKTYPKKQNTPLPANAMPPHEKSILKSNNLSMDLDGRRNPFKASFDIPYYTDVTWLEDGQHLMVNLMNRAQKVGQIVICQAGSGQCKSVYNQKVSPRVGGWIDPINKFTVESFNQISPEASRISSDIVRLFTILPRTVANGNQYNQVARLTIDKAKFSRAHQAKLQFITSGPLEAVEILAHDPSNSILYFTAAPLDKPGQRHLYSVNTSLGLRNEIGSTHQSMPECLTCDPKFACEYVSPVFSPGLTWCQIWCLGSGIPTMSLYPTSHIRQRIIDNLRESLNETSKNDTPTTVFNNTQLKDFLQDKLLPSRIYLNIPGPDNHTFTAIIVLPPHFKENNHKKYPLLIEMYGGPESQIVDSMFGLTWSTFVSSYYNVVVARIDGRGASYRGRKFMVEVYKELGEKEAFDQLFAIKYILKKIPIIDPHNVAIWGWSFGGYLTSVILASPLSLGLIKCGIAVAPVIDWRYYDSAYSERYMGTFEENSFNYQKSGLLDKVKNFHFHKYLLIHGTADDNVHFQHAAHFIKELVKENVQFDLMVYPDETHNLRGVTRHLYSKMTSFLIEQCFEKEYMAHSEQVIKYEFISNPNQFLTLAPNELTDKDD